MSLVKSTALVLVSGVVWSAAAQRAPLPAPRDGADRALYLKAALPLDEPRHLCVDVPGHGEAADPDRPLGVHTCKDGMWNLDQRFRWSDEEGLLRMPQYGRCLAAGEAEPGAAMVLTGCDSGELSAWRYDEARLKLAARPELCLTIAAGKSELTQGGRRFATRYVSRAISLETCSQEALERQLFSIAEPLPISESLLPPAAP